MGMYIQGIAVGFAGTTDNIAAVEEYLSHQAETDHPQWSYLLVLSLQTSDFC